MRFKGRTIEYGKAVAPWRIEYEGAFYHVVSRGNDGQEIFYGDRDKRRFLDTIGEMSDRFDVDIFAYVLMSTISGAVIRFMLMVERRMNG